VLKRSDRPLTSVSIKILHISFHNALKLILRLDPSCPGHSIPYSTLSMHCYMHKSMVGRILVFQNLLPGWGVRPAAHSSEYQDLVYLFSQCT